MARRKVLFMLTKEQSKIVEENVALAYNRAKKLYKEYRYKLTNVNTPLDDIRAEAVMGLIQAVQRYDESKGFKLSTFAVHHIDNRVRKHVVKNNCILKIPRSDQIRYNIHKGNIEILRMYVSGSNIIDINSPVTGGDGDNKEVLLVDVLESKFDMLFEELLILADQVLTNREFKIFYNYFVEDRVQDAIAMELGISQVHISRLLKSARNKIKKAMQVNVL